MTQVLTGLLYPSTYNVKILAITKTPSKILKNNKMRFEEFILTLFAYLLLKIKLQMAINHDDFADMIKTLKSTFTFISCWVKIDG